MEPIISSLWNELTWHTLIEVIAIIVATMIVHPLISGIKRVLAKLIETVALSNRTIARYRIRHYFRDYEKLKSMHDSFRLECFKSAIHVGSQLSQIMYEFTLSVIFFLMSNIAAIIGYKEHAYIVEFSVILSVMLLLIGLRSVTIMKSISHRLLYFEGFTIYVIKRILTLQSRANMDDMIAEFWRKNFPDRCWPPENPD